MYQVQVIDGGTDIFNALAYGEKHPSTLRYIESQFDNISNTLTEAGRSFFNGAKQIYDAANNSEVMRLARLAAEKVKGVFQRDVVKSMWDLVEIQSAGNTMQRWIMAEPTVRQMFYDQQCDGFSETFIDRFPGDIGENHYDYRRVMNGMVQDDPEHDWRATIYLDDIYTGDRELTLDEQVDILNTWDIVRGYMKQGKDDPTSQFGGSL